MAKQEIVLVTGGARSGKSGMALRLVSGDPCKIFLATAEALDQEMADRIRNHRRERNGEWMTVEEPLQPERVFREYPTHTIVMDCVTLWLSNLMMRSWDEQKIDDAVQGLCEALTVRRASTIVVTNEVGLGIVPENKMGRMFRDLAGKTNQRIAEISHRVILMVSGIPLYIR